MSTVGDRIKQLREARGLTQERLAELADITLPGLQKIEYGDRTGRGETHQKIASALGVPVSYLTYGDTPQDQAGKKFIPLSDILTEEDEDIIRRFALMIQLRRHELNLAHNAAIEAKYDLQLQEEARLNGELKAKDDERTERRHRLRQQEREKFSETEGNGRKNSA